jgi:hypothetical protein
MKVTGHRSPILIRLIWISRQALSIVVGGNEIPVNQLPECCNVVRPLVAVVDIVSVFPYIAGQLRQVFLRHRVIGIVGVDDLETARIIFDQPCPSRTEVADSRCGKLLFKCLEVAESLVDGLAELEIGCATTVRAQSVPVKSVVPYLRSIIEKAAGRPPDDFLERRGFKFCARDHAIELGDVCCMMLAVVKLKGFGTDMRFQGIFGVR